MHDNATTSVYYRDPHDIYAPQTAGVRFGKRTRAEAKERAEALRILIGGRQVVYAIRLADGTIKIGCTGNLQLRRDHYPDGEIIGFTFGDHDAEQAVHRQLRASVARGREYYHPTPAVLAVVNDMRTGLGLAPIAA